MKNKFRYIYIQRKYGMDRLKFIEKAREIHGDKYDYSKIEYKGAHTKICIICPKHGEFWQTPTNHTHKTKPHGCPKCKGGIKSSCEEFIEKAKKIHGNKYDYSKVEYINNHTKVCIICPKHGEFWQIPNSHLSGKGCKFCINDVYDTDSFAKKATLIHNKRYSYKNVAYTNSHTKVNIICNTCGETFMQTPNDHLSGKGCPYCKKWKLEEKIKKALTDENIAFIWQCGKETLPWIGRQKLDFYLPEYNIAIECQGIQHFKSKENFGGDKSFIETEKRDKLKKEKCVNNITDILYFSEIKCYETFLGKPLYKKEKDLVRYIIEHYEKKELL